MELIVLSGINKLITIVGILDKDDLYWISREKIDGYLV